jgi:CheY-like chemotaxis protein
MELTTIKILLVEDDDIDATTVMRGLASAKIGNPVIRARDGVEALEILRGSHGREKLQPPYLLLVDIRMPRLDGLGLIREIRNTPALRRTVIFVLTTSSSDRDQAAAYEGHVAGYIVKSHTSQQFLQLARMLEYYLLIVSPPPTDSSTTAARVAPAGTLSDRGLFRAVHRLIEAWTQGSRGTLSPEA